MREASMVVTLVVSLLLVAVVAALALEPERQDAPGNASANCPGLADKAVLVTDNLISVDETVSTVRDAEDLLCLDLPEPALADAWRVTNVSVYGEAESLTDLQESGLAYVLVGIELVNEDLDLALHIYEESGASPFDTIEPVDTSRYAPAEPLRLGNEDASLRFNDRGAFLVTWSKPNFQLYATGLRDALPSSLPLLESIQ